MAEPSNNDSSGHDADSDRVFEPTADMLVHDYDDETTIEEQEALSNESGSDELNALHEEAEMPIEALMALYYGSGQQPDPRAVQYDDTSTSTSSSSSFSPGSRQRGRRREDDILSNQDLTLDKEEVARDILRDDDGSETSVDELLESVHSSSHTACLLGRMHPEGEASDDIDYSDEEDSEDDMEYVPINDDESWRKDIKVGADYQAEIPEYVRMPRDSPAPADCDSVMWDPSRLPEHTVVGYLNEVRSLTTMNNGTARFRSCLDSTVQEEQSSKCIGDNEQALQTLLQLSYDTAAALREIALRIAPNSDLMTVWSESCCQSFEAGLREHGKNFSLIQKNKMPSKTTGELVNFYYFWKKTERRAQFPSKISSVQKLIAMQSHSSDNADSHLMDRVCELDKTTGVASSSSSGGVEDVKGHRLSPGPTTTLLDNDIPVGDMDGRHTVTSLTFVQDTMGTSLTDIGVTGCPPSEARKPMLSNVNPTSSEVAPLTDNGLGSDSS